MFGGWCMGGEEEMEEEGTVIEDIYKKMRGKVCSICKVRKKRRSE